MIVTPGVVDESVALTAVATAPPWFWRVTLIVNDSPGSGKASPSPAAGVVATSWTASRAAAVAPLSASVS